MNIEIGQIWKLKDKFDYTGQHSEKQLTIAYVGTEYFISEEKPLDSYVFALLYDKYDLIRPSDKNTEFWFSEPLGNLDY